MENLFIETTSALGPAVEQSDAAIKKDSQDAQQVAEILREKTATLQTKLREAEETIRTQEKEIQNLKGNVDVLVGQVKKFALSDKQTKPQVATKSADREQITESSNARIAGLEARIKELQEIVRHKESAIDALKQNHSAKTRDWETQLKNKEKLLLDREKKVTDLESELKTVVGRMKEISSSLRQAEALASIEAQERGGAAAGQPDGDKEKLPASRLNGPEVAFTAVDEVAVPLDLFDRITRELTQIMGPLAAAIVHHDVAALGESIVTFPRRRLAELLDTVTREIADENLKRTFRERFIKKT